MEIIFLKAKDVMQKTKLSKTTLYERTQRGEFMKPVKMGPRASFWLAHEVEAFQRAVIAGASPERLRALVVELEAARKGEAA